MRESLFSPLWHRYSQQRPQLRSHITVQPQRYRNQFWYLLINDTKGNHYRINDIAYQFVGRCDGRFSVQEIWESMLETLGDNAPTQGDVIRLLTELDQRDLIRYEVLPDIPGMFRRKLEKDNRQRLAFINPLAFRLPLWDPSKLLDRLGWLQKLTFNPITLALWIIIVTAATFAAASHWDELRQHASNYMATPHYLFLAWLSFPIIKSLHELGHALAVRHWDGQVKETGITFFVLTPAPYVDASASIAFRSRSQRIIVSAMGMMVELLLAAFALAIWFNTQLGLVHDLAFVTMFICSVSSLLFNGNPLLRFDAYYMLCDAIDLPNLAVRSRLFWTNLIKRLVLGPQNIIPMPLASGERKWLIAYAPLSFAYGIFIVSYIIIWLGAKSVVMGLLAALFALFSMVIKPLFTSIRGIITAAATGSYQRRAKMMITAVLLFTFMLLCEVPVPFNTTAQGVIWIPEQAQIRPITEGFIKEILARHGEQVEPNQIIFVLEDPTLIAERDKLNSQLTGLRADHYNLIFQDPVRAAGIGEKIENVSAELQRIEERISGLQVRSQAKGNLVMPHQNDLPGIFVQKGSVLGYVLDKDIIKVRAAIPEPDAALVRERLKGIQVRTADHPNHAITASMSMDTPAVTRTLPSPAMGDRGGGRYVTDPADENGLTTVEPLVLIDLNLPATSLERVGARANVRFDHGFEPIAVQLYRHLRQLFLQHFNPAD
ncbi:MAG: PqqD family peptide modification chaperone [Methylotenera sp.]